MYEITGRVSHIDQQGFFAPVIFLGANIRIVSLHLRCTNLPGSCSVPMLWQQCGKFCGTKKFWLFPSLFSILKSKSGSNLLVSIYLILGTRKKVIQRLLSLYKENL